MPPRPECEFHFDLPQGIDSDEILPSDGDQEVYSLSQDDLTLVESVQERNGGHQTLYVNDTVLSSRKSPRRLDFDDHLHIEIPRAKKPRQSLFGGPMAEDKEKHQGDNLSHQNGENNVPETPRNEIRQRMSSLTLNQQNSGDLPDPLIKINFNLDASGETPPSSVSSRAQSEEPPIIPPDNQPVYELRKNINRAKTITHIDTDKTGNYDPAHEAKLKALRLQRAKANKAAKKKRKEKKPQIPKFIIKLRFADRFGDVRNITNEEENWPEGWSESDSGRKPELKKNCRLYRCNTPGVEVQKTIQDPSGDVDDLTGYPAARGCRCCRRFEKACSMIEGGSYPCQQCEDEEEDVVCEPILNSTVKGGCKRCIYEDEICSFENDPDQSRCDTCAENDQICEAIPPKGYKAPRASINDIMYGPDRKHTQCTVCRIEKRNCSLKTKSNRPPCKTCKKNGLGCTFYDLPNSKVDKKVATKNKVLDPVHDDAPEVFIPNKQTFSAKDIEDMMTIHNEDAVSRETTPEMTMEDEAGNVGVVTQINSSFSHPLHFNATADCNFCEMPGFSFVGHFERTVHVIKWDSGLGYTELGGGHSEDKGATNMCDDCTNLRLQILFCTGHNFVSIPHNAAHDFDTVAEDLFSAEPGSPEAQHELQRWCSLCFSVAKFACMTAQALVTGDGEVPSCGARLCNRCMEALQNRHSWDFQALVVSMDAQPKTKENGQNGALEGKARADAALLSREGLLLKCVTVELENNFLD
ncbi:hypothetical protein GQ44DRAFT_644745 [Phaeosphaeriaceae sp. PMI808]|nr:hypothetical protein GQ44DRAFT_644745 [Phaeosphaeriaceae sp. PMI808]